MSGISLKIKLQITIVSSSIIKYLFSLLIIWLSLPTKLSEGSRASEFIQVLILVRFPESYFGDQIRQRSEKINFSQKFTDIIKNTNIQQLVSKCPKNELQDMCIKQYQKPSLRNNDKILIAILYVIVLHNRNDCLIGNYCQLLDGYRINQYKCVTCLSI
ncbi:Hypothetical_protein [Hexamita inflata]|uniref:Hypothetical_protein n=1 Tax=Hexamita inflata TaxID=28002 RepID=A0AA86TNX3_9EUKA|nr:Hypothetical protein HINF_LOCUS10800 [Hexamita inflata]